MKIHVVFLACIFAFFLALPFSHAITNYDIIVEEKTTINMTFELYTQTPAEKVNFWKSSIAIEPEAKVIQVSDTKGVIKDYTFQNSMLTFQTNQGPPRTKEVVTVLYEIDAVDTVYHPLKKLSLKLSGFEDKRADVPDEVTTAVIHLDEAPLSETHNFGFISEIEGKTLKYKGSGPLSIISYFSDAGKHFDHYVLFGTRANLSRADNMYGIVVAVTKSLPSFDLFPVVLLKDNKYEEVVNKWSAGQYVGGVIFAKTTAAVELDFTSTVLHETAHGFNEEAMRWTEEIPWFDEGVSKYIEFISNKKMGIRQAEIFGKPVKWKEGNKYFTYPPRSTPEELWNYYTNNENFMETWTTKNPSTREFGYAFSELIIREFVLREGYDALHGVYEGMAEIDEKKTREEGHAMLLSLLGSDMRPCYSQDREVFDSCLEMINSMDPEIPESVIIKGEKEEIIIEPIQYEQDDSPLDQITYFFQQLGQFFRDLFSQIASALGF
jgi:hypothetical protein